MKNTCKLLLFCCIAVCICSCYKKDTTMSLDQGVVSHFSYQPGSYWIYKDSISGQSDSLVVISTKSGVYSDANGTYNDIEITPRVYKYEPIADTGFYIGWKLYSNIAALTIFGLTSQSPQVRTGISYPLKADNVDGIIDRMSVAGTDYLNVAQLRTNSSDKVYAVADVGVIKMRLVSFPGAPVWELQRANIVIK